MIKVKLTTSFPEHPIVRQTPDSSGIWKNCQFFINEDVEECDYWFVYEGLKKNETTRCSPDNIIFITGEPPEVRDYSKLFLNQFANIITCHNFRKRKIIKDQQALPWHIGLKNNVANKDYDFFANFNNFNKENLISVITSNKVITEGHRKRIEIVNHLKNHFGEQLQVFGKGFNPVEDKWDAIQPFKYHIVIENSSNVDYWTEKLSDCFLANSFPIYFGCPNINKYFEENSLLNIDIYNTYSSIHQIEQLIKEDDFEKKIPQIIEAKNRVLNKYNLFSVMFNLVNDKESLAYNKPKRKIELKKEFSVRAEKYINYFLK